MDLEIIEQEVTPVENISLGSLRDKKKYKPKEYEIQKVELSKNIQKFDKKPRVYTENPYAFNTISLKKNKPNVTPNQSASDLITNPTYNMMGKFLGVDTIHDWNRYYDKIYAITEWAKLKSGEKDTNKLVGWVNSRAKSIPNMGMKEIDSLYLHARMFLNKK